MNQNFISLIDSDNKVLEVEFLIGINVDSNKYIIYTKNEKDNENHIIIYVGKQNILATKKYLQNITDEITWDKIKIFMKDIVKLTSATTKLVSASEFSGSTIETTRLACVSENVINAMKTYYQTNIVEPTNDDIKEVTDHIDKIKAYLTKVKQQKDELIFKINELTTQKELLEDRYQRIVNIVNNLQV